MVPRYPKVGHSYLIGYFLRSCNTVTIYMNFLSVLIPQNSLTNLKQKEMLFF